MQHDSVSLHFTSLHLSSFRFTLSPTKTEKGNDADQRPNHDERNSGRAAAQLDAGALASHALLRIDLRRDWIVAPGLAKGLAFADARDVQVRAIIHCSLVREDGLLINAPEEVRHVGAVAAGEAVDVGIVRRRSDGVVHPLHSIFLFADPEAVGFGGVLVDAIRLAGFAGNSVPPWARAKKLADDSGDDDDDGCSRSVD
eukprot:CAMPEP_0198119576 /NCGR_PEP_ID=MMETSP1442-20131203/26138_1 /TAXON_ID= /ORGANISM="Craspedostauros australis, Strain CCMP3328" /LENGTH=198 /DNA_ID=CAMNT_0043778083 /DNA_START=501 /DNA_END=1099 /DNA_ORIENTATION=+